MNSLALTLLIGAFSSSAFAADIVAPIAEDPVAATPQISGYVEAYLGGLRIPDFEDDTYRVYGGAGRLNAPIGDRWNIQGDVIVDHTDFDDNLEVTGVGGAVHAYWRNPSSFAVGAFGTYSHFNVDEFNGNFNTLSAGPEAQVYLNNFTLYGQAYYGELDLRDTGFQRAFDFWGGRGVVRYFALPNLRFDAELGYRRLDIDFGSGHLDTMIAATQAMYRFEALPVSVFGRYQFENNLADSPDEDLDTHKFTLGLRASFGTQTLIDEDRSGATMDTDRTNFEQVPFQP